MVDKKQKPIEYRRYIDEQTGEVHEVPVMVHFHKGNKNFEMIFYGHFLEIINDLGNKRIQVLQHIIKNRDRFNNTFIGTQESIEKSLSISHATIVKTLQLLEDKGVIKRKTGVIYIDADLICDGRFKDRIMHVYHNVEDFKPEEQESRLNREIERKEQELEELKRMKELQKRVKLEIVSPTEEEVAELEAEFNHK